MSSCSVIFLFLVSYDHVYDVHVYDVHVDHVSSVLFTYKCVTY